jgi:hypothetical protein
VYNIAGILVRTIGLEKPVAGTTIDLSGEAVGVYIVVAETDKGTQRAKVSITR